ncbi:hypothetical protein EWB00_004207 [Schistosoma japonicum]|uniref:Shisa N-terminal domain-containing protein n=1 Tax=Schistosoma japonicum TaxID=6182 RepID=A0A4Z2DVA5_SCHJA|nr:jumonji domain containing protein [Schistosoma japonicum]TNN20387.1 hypothetical protein EWB00_004207 [Schistosoma japonicum]
MGAGVSNYSIPNEVLFRYGGITNDQKKYLHSKIQSLNFVYIPSFLRRQISSFEPLYQYGVCQSPREINGETYEYFICPMSLNAVSTSFEGEQRFCCGSPPQQYCCTSTQFSSGIQIVRSDLLISPSIVIGVSVTFLLFGVFCIVYAYSRLARNLRKTSNILFYELNCNMFASSALHQPVHSIELTVPPESQSNEPPKKRLLSGSRLTKISPEKSNVEITSENTNNYNLPSISNNSKYKENNSINYFKLRSSFKMDSSNDENSKLYSTPIKARPVLTRK